jgi:uncharacterized protein YjbI with pentapeptide repeats
MSTGSKEHIQDNIEAADLAKTVTETTEPVITLHDKHISGTLDLRYRTIHAAVDLQGCHFLGDVDLRWCNFEQTVNFSGCTFHQAFNKIGETYDLTIHCKKDFICAAAHFEGPFSLNSAQIEGVANFQKAQFKNRNEVDFTGLKSTGQLNCIDATFNGPVSFNALKCEGSGVFHRTTFSGGADFVSASFGSVLECTGATFKGSVSMNSVKCEGAASFEGATFVGVADFTGALFGSSLECIGAAFIESADFGNLKTEANAFFDGVKFGSDVSFANASIGTDLSCGWHETQGDVVFKGGVTLYALRCGGDGRFWLTQFQSPKVADFSFSRFGGSLRFTGSSFSGRVQLEAVEVARELDLTAEWFSDVSLYNATTEVLALTYEERGTRYTFPRKQARLDLRRSTFKWPRRVDEGDPQSEEHQQLEEDQQLKEDLQFAASLDLRGFTFKRLRGSKEEALQFAKAQKPTAFSLDPYVQLEEYYEKVGKDTEARDVHYEGRHAMRRNTATSSEVTWTWGRKASDSFLRALTGYGVRTSRVALAIGIFLVLGTIVFSLGDFTPLGEALGNKNSATSAASAAARNLSDSEPTVIDQISYSVDRFIPINMGFEDGFEPRQPWSQAYALIHVVAGWLLIPLFLVSWSGLVRSRR